MGVEGGVSGYFLSPFRRLEHIDPTVGFDRLMYHIVMDHLSDMCPSSEDS